MRRVLPVLLWAVAFLLFAVNYAPLNDHYGRISPARQIARYGEAPFRDFFDPGYYLTEYSSAALQIVLGDNLLGELLLNVSFIATGTLLVFLLARRASRSTAIGLIGALIAVMTMPRLYDYDKVLFYPLTVALCWRYVDRRDATSLAWLAAAIAVAGLYRYDNGVFLGLAALAAIAIDAGDDWRTSVRRCSQLVALSVVFASPGIVAVAVNGGLAEAVDQAVTYGQRETRRTRIDRPPSLALWPLARLQPLPPVSNTVAVRWAPEVDQETRLGLERQYTLANPVPHQDPTSRTWTYALQDHSSGNIRRLIADPRVEDTDGIDRGRGSLPPEPVWMRVQRAVPLLTLRLFPTLLDYDNGSAFVYYVLALLPVGALVVAVFFRRRRSGPDAAPASIVGSMIVLCVLLDVFILRSPVSARVGGMIAPFVVLGAWMVARVHDAMTADASSVTARRRVTYGVAAVSVFVLLLTVQALSAATYWPGELRVRIANLPTVAGQLRRAAASPPPLEFLPTGSLGRVIEYVRECTQPDDRVFATWFVPELYVFAQRAFAGGMVVAFGEHWSEPRHQARIVAQLQSQSVPLVISEADHHADFMNSYPRVRAYLDQRYRAAGNIVSGGSTYFIFADRMRTPVRVEPSLSLPCFR